MFDWISKLPNLWSTAQKTKEALEYPAETSGDLAEGIVKTQPEMVQKLIVIVLLIIATLLGADMGIEYQKSQAQTLLAGPQMSCPACPKCPEAIPLPERKPEPEPKQSNITTEPIPNWPPKPESSLALPAPVKEAPRVAASNFNKPAARTERTGRRVKAAKARSTVSHATVQRKKHPAGTRHASKPNRRVAAQGRTRNAYKYKVWKPLPLRELSSSGPGGY